MRVNFIDMASEHAMSLINFHHYACFFLLIVITFVIWVLKLVLNFITFEKHLLYENNVYFSFYKTNTHFFYFYSLLKLVLFGVVSDFLFDFFYFITFFFNVTKLKFLYSLKKVEFLGSALRHSDLPVLPTYFSFFSDYIRVYDYDFFNYYLRFRKVETTSNLNLLKILAYSFDFFVYFKCVDIPWYDEWDEMESWVAAVLYVGSYFVLFNDSYLVSRLPSFIGINNSYLTFPFNSGIFAKNKSTGLVYFSFAGLAAKWYKKREQNLSLSTRFETLLLSLPVLSKDLSYNSLENTGLLPAESFKDYPIFTALKFYNRDSKGLFFLFFQNVKHRKVLEWIWTGVPALILLCLLYPSLSLLYGYDRPYVTRPYVTVKAIGHQWYWSYEYSDFVSNAKYLEHVKFDSYLQYEEDLVEGQHRLLEVDRRIILPVGVCIRVITTSADVLHSWAVPALGVKIDSVPGRLNQFWITVDRPGTFYGQCSELCGVNHGFMPIVADATQLDRFVNYFKRLQ